MTTRLSDNRKYSSMTVAEADAMFQRLAMLEINIKRSAAAADKKIAEIKEKHANETDSARREYNDLCKELDGYILANKDRFIKPRQRQTEFGKYGLRTATALKITDEDAVVRSSDELKLALYSTKKTVDKKAVEKALSDGMKISGAVIESGDIASFSVEKKLMDAEIKE